MERRDMPLQLRRLTAAEFCQRIVPSLLEREAENGLAIGIARRLAGSAGSAPAALLLALEAAGTVVGAAVWTPPHDVVATRLPPGAADLVADSCAGSGWPVSGASGPDTSGRELAEALARHSRSAVRVRMRQRLYALSRVDEVPAAAGAMRPAVTADLELVAGWYALFAQEVNLAHAMDASDWASGAIASGSVFLSRRR
jgi:hypothetical protein